MSSLEKLRLDDPLLHLALRAGGMTAFTWDSASGLIQRTGDLAGFLDLPAGERGAPLSAALAHMDAALAARAATLTPREPELVHEYRLLVAGRVRWVRETVRATFDTGGSLMSAAGVAVNITEQRDAESRLQLIATVSERIGAAEDVGDLLFQVASAIGEHLHVRRALFTEIDLDHDRGVVRRDYCRGVESVAGVYRVTDYSELTRREMAAGRAVVNHDSRTDPRTAADYARTYEKSGERAYIAVPLLRDGRWVAELWVSDDVPRHWTEQEVALVTSLAERTWTAIEKLRVNAALRESEARMTFVGERAGIGYWYWDIRADALYWSPVCCELHGLPAQEKVSYARYLETVHPDDRDAVDHAVRSTLEKGGPADFENECRVLLPDGTVRWIHGKGSATFEDGVPVRMAGIAIDITARKTLERERELLLETERRLRVEAD
jgi:PAS domain S-box-containing protein